MNNTSNELQIGKAAEHYVCYNLIMKGYNAFLADQGCPFDIVVEKNTKLYSIQVRSTTKLITNKKCKNIYRFSMRRGKGSKRTPMSAVCDYYAFVALDIGCIAYLTKKEMISKTSGKIKTTMDFKTKNVIYEGRIYSNGTIRTPEWGKYIQDYQNIKL